MPILEDDIQVVASTVMDDVPEGGGAPSAVVIVDGASNGIFEDVTDLDAANGNVSLRKTFLRVNTATTDKYMGSNVIVAAEPGDPLLSLTLFETQNFFDTRSEAVSRLESYLSAGGAWNGYLYGLHVAGQKIVQFIQRVDSELPKIGAVFALVQDEGYPAQVMQYVRVKRCTFQVVTFADDGGDFVRWVVSCEIDSALERDFKGLDASRQASNKGGAGRTIVRGTIVADAARYYGFQPLAQAATREQSQVKVASIFTQLVPSSEIEVPVADAAPNGAILTPIRSANGEMTVNLPVLNSVTAGYLGGSVMPGSVRGASAGNNMLIDKGDGSLFDAAGQVGSIDYQNGIVSVTGGSYGGDFAFVPAAYQSVTSESASVSFTAESRPGSIALSITPPPPPGTLTYTYFAQGKRYVLRDDGSGALRGDDPAYGAGKINFATGGITITMGALPDAPSLGVLNWSPALTVARGYTGTVKGQYKLAFGVAIAPAVCALTWELGGQTRTASISAAGVVSGAATGRITWATGEMDFQPDAPLPVGTTVSLTYKEPVTATSTPITLALLDQGASLEATLAGGCAPGAFRGQVSIKSVANYGSGVGGSSISVRTIEDDGAGGVQIVTITSGGAKSANKIGTIVYATGVIRIDKTASIPGESKSSYYNSTDGGRTYSVKTASTNTNEIQVSAGITGVIASGTATATEHTVTAATGDLLFELPRGGGARFVSGSINLIWGNRRYVDRLGRMLHTINTATGTGVDGGEIDYQSGVFKPADYTGITTTVATLASSAEQSGLAYLSGGCFLTPVAPVRSGQLSIAATLADGSTQVSASFATTGYLVSDHAVGVADFTAGWARVWFRVAAAIEGVSTVVDLTEYKIPGVTTIHAVPALAESFRFSCVGYSFLPVDASVMGIDPVRLPSDGRVPIFTDGSMVVIHNTQTTSSRAVAAGDTINCGRTRLARATLRGADGKRIKTGFTADLDAGVITITDPTGFVQPVRVEHRIEDFLKVLNVDINGTLTLARKLSHDFPLDGSGASSCMILGDLKARVAGVWDQKTWTGIWADSQVGDAATASYDTIHYPIEVTNAGAFTERWAIVIGSSATEFYLVGEHLGVVASGNTATDFAPINPSSGTPYMTIKAAGWGAYWAAGNVLRINTVGAIVPIWQVLTCQMGVLTNTQFNPSIQIRGNVDRP